ncbi:hypothetical protein D9M68_689950 [compost metagenome]
MPALQVHGGQPHVTANELRQHGHQTPALDVGLEHHRRQVDDACAKQRRLDQRTGFRCIQRSADRDLEWLTVDFEAPLGQRIQMAAEQRDVMRKFARMSWHTMLTPVNGSRADSELHRYQFSNDQVLIG